MSLATNPWPTSFENDEDKRRHNDMSARSHQFRANSSRTAQEFVMPRSSSHESGWNAYRTAPTVGVVQPLNTVRPHITQATSDTFMQKEKVPNQRNIPPHVPPRNDCSISNEVIKDVKLRGNNPSAVDPWKATPEQKKFYFDEFEKLPKVQEYVDGYLCLFIDGKVAKDFFLKSKLPNEELIQIWELADIDKDGRLTKLEFSLAFHFTSARRNNYPLPEQIPQQLYNNLLETAYIGIDHGDARVDDENWETFSEKSFSTVSSAATLPKFATSMANKTEVFHPVPMRMTPSSVAARSGNPYQVMDPPSTTESKRDMYLKIDRTPADGSSSAQSSSSSSPTSDHSTGGINESQSNLSYSSSKPLRPSSGDESNDSSTGEAIKTHKSSDFADFQTFEKLLKSKEIDDISVNSSVDSVNVCTETETDFVQLNESEIPKVDAVSTTPATVTSTVSSQPNEIRTREIEQVRSMVASLRERNCRLTRLNQALSIELKDIISERVLLEARNGE